MRRLKNSMAEALPKRGFRVIEIICPCPTAYARKNRLGTGLDLLKYYHDNSIIKHGADPKEADIGMSNKLICGKFVDEDRPTFRDFLTQNVHDKLGG
jgi:2-oxoglutarate ferredoxin oxidoreductase subunit beta